MYLNSGYLFKDKNTLKTIHTSMYITTLFTIIKIWKQPQCHQKMMDREDIYIYIYTHTRVCVCVCVMKYYSATKVKYWYLQQLGWTLKSYAKLNVRWRKTKTA